jgi:hypothetical protein
LRPLDGAGSADIATQAWRQNVIAAGAVESVLTVQRVEGWPRTASLRSDHWLDAQFGLKGWAAARMLGESA